MKIPTITVKKVMSWSPCYTEGKIQGFFRKKKSLTLLEVLRLKKVSTEDKFWALLRNDFFTVKELRLLSCDFAEHTLWIFEKYNKEDKRPHQAIETARKYAKGEATEEERAAAMDAARAAAWAAMDARAAARAAWAAGAARAAARAARAAAMDAEEKWQIKKVKELILSKWGV